MGITREGTRQKTAAFGNTREQKTAAIKNTIEHKRKKISALGSTKEEEIPQRRIQ